MRRPELEHELVLVAEVDGLQMLALLQIPEMQPPAVFGAKQHFRDQPVLECVGRAPLAGDQRVVAEVPPGIISEILRPAIHLPLPEHVEGLVIHQEDAARSLALAVAEGGDIDALGAAMHRMRARVTGLVGDFVRLNHLDDLRVSRIGLGVEDVDARRPQARHHQIAALDMRMRRVGTQAGGASIPAEMMQLITGVGHRRRADDLGVRF